MLIPLFLLVIFGSLVLYSAAGGNLYPFAASHLIRFFILMVFTAILSSLPLLFIKYLAYPVYFFGLFLLVLVEITGSIGGGSQRWLDLGVIRLQPSELMKPIIVLTIAKFYSNLPPVLTSNWRAIIIPSAIMTLPVALILRQPDLGTSLAILAGGIIVMFLAGIPFKWFIKAAGVVLLASPFSITLPCHHICKDVSLRSSIQKVIPLVPVTISLNRKLQSDLVALPERVLTRALKAT